MKKCALILPYFGSFNNYFQLFLNSFWENNSFELLIFTDSNQKYEYPNNVKVIPYSLSMVKEKLETVLGFKVCLDAPYKLCDYKPTYGLVFEDYLREYEYWGHCDCDLIFGDLEHILLPLLEDNYYDKLFAAGHLTLYRNTDSVNRLFMSQYLGKEIYREAFQNNAIYVFDEDYKDNNVHRIFKEKNRTVYEEDLSMNPTSRKSRFIRSFYAPTAKAFLWEPTQAIKCFWDGKSIYKYWIDSKSKEVRRKEYLYMHLQGRIMSMSDSVLKANVVEISPTRFIPRNALPRGKDELKIYEYYFPNTFWYRIYRKKLWKKISPIIKK